MQLSPKKIGSEVQERLVGVILGEYTRALRAGDSEAAYRVIEELADKSLSLADIYLKLLTPALTAIGESWCVGDIGPGQEHLATQIVLGQLDRLRGIFGTGERRLSYRVLVSCVEGEQHAVGARMFADLCLAQGWSVDYFGPDLPSVALLEMINLRQPQIVGLSVTMARHLDSARRLISDLALLPAPPKILLGGQALLANDFHVPAGADNFAVAIDALAGVDIAARWQRADRPKTVLKEYLIGLGRHVRQLRSQRGWTQEQLAQAARVTRVCIVAVEGGKQNVSMDIVVRMANALGITPQGLLTGEEQQLRPSGRGA